MNPKIFLLRLLLLEVNLLYILTTIGGCFGDQTIRIAAYDPHPQEYLSGRMIARRMGPDPGIIEDVIRPPRQAISGDSRRRRPLSRFSPRQRLRSSIPRVTDETETEIDPDDVPLGPPLVLDPQMFNNPNGPVTGPVGPPTSTLRSAFVAGVVQPPSISPPAAPNGGFIFGAPSPPGSAFPPSPPGFLTGGMPSIPGEPKPPGGMSPGGIVGPPSPSNLGALPPSKPETAQSPAPPPGSDESQVTNIKCFQFGNTETFEAVLSLPVGYEAVPVFEDKPMIDPTTNQNCRMIPTQPIGMFNLLVSNYEACGVRKCRQSNGETWNCLILRFPRLHGLKLPEDEIIDIRCRPHDRTADDSHDIAFATANNDKTPTVFEGLQEFECEIGLVRQLPGTETFNSRVKDTPLDLGEHVQLWSIIKDGDGWEYSRLTDVFIYKDTGNRQRSALNTAVLVFNDGCRNPSFKVIAPDHPFRDPKDKLVNKFTFRVFLFQDMEPGETLNIQATVIGCILEEDCEPTICNDDGKMGYGRRRRRAAPKSDVREFEFATTVQVPDFLSRHEKRSSESFFKKNTTDWSRNMAIRIKMPDGQVKQKLIEFQDCNLLLLICFAIVLFFCILTIGFVLCVVCRRKRKVDPVSVPEFPPSTESKRKYLKQSSNRVKEPVRATISSSESTTSSDLSSVAAPEFKHFPVPPTVRKRKNQVNAELLGLFGNEAAMMPYPPMLNYYGYMVVPHPSSAPTTQQKKRSVRAVKRTDRERGLPEVFNDTSQSPVPSSDICSCSEVVNGTAEEVHKSIIKITSEPQSVKSHRRQKQRSKDPIYCEIQEDTLPTMV